MTREALKTAILARLSAVADMHPMGHQASYANRYTLPVGTGATVELMFQKGENSPANLWVQRNRVLPLIGGPIKHAHSEAVTLYSKTNAKGEKLYGRHSALEKMPKLGKADLVCFALASVGELDTVLATLKTATVPSPN